MALTVFFEHLNKANEAVYAMFNSARASGTGTASNLTYRHWPIHFPRTELPLPRMLHRADASFIAPEIFNHITEHSDHVYHFTFVLPPPSSRKYQLYFITDETVEMLDPTRATATPIANAATLTVLFRKYAYKMAMWLYMLDTVYRNNASPCKDALDVYIYLTSFKKMLPQHLVGGVPEIIAPFHVNSGVTTTCNTHAAAHSSEIVIFRKEEWFKVFLHETLHNFNVDFSEAYIRSQEIQRAMHDGIRHVYNLPPGLEVLLSETYTEVWARILNVGLYVYFTPTTMDSTAFLQRMQALLQKEADFSVQQAAKVLDYMNLDYDIVSDVKSSAKKQNAAHFYKEDTNVFAYYVLPSVAMMHWPEFMEWCIRMQRGHGTTGLPLCFHSTAQHISAFVDFFKPRARAAAVQQRFQRNVHSGMVSYKKDTGLRMTITPSV